MLFSLVLCCFVEKPSSEKWEVSVIWFGSFYSHTREAHLYILFVYICVSSSQSGTHKLSKRVNVFTLTVWHANVFLRSSITWRKCTVGFSVNVLTPLYKHIPQTDSFFLCKCVGCQLLAPWPVGGPCCSVQTLTTVPTNQSAGRCLISWSNIFIFLFQHYSFTGNCIITSQR